MNAHLLESPQADEAEVTRELIESLRQMMIDRHDGRTMRRDVHIKMHALLKAEFTVEPGLPPELRVGLFREPRSYRAWVRLSNASNVNQADAKGDIRGMAIKLMGVPGPRILDAHAGQQTHDFIFITAPRFPTRDVRQFLGLELAVVGSLWTKLCYFATNPSVAWILFRTFRRFANPLRVPYYSSVPYLFGDRAVKYRLMPVPADPAPMPFDPPENLLRQAAASQLAAGEAVFEFGVQFQTDPATMPVENGQALWSEAASPFRKLATLRFAPQTFDNDAQNAFGENLSFTPWRCLPEHRPLGGLNRARRVIYETLSNFRHEKNGVPRREPEGWEI